MSTAIKTLRDAGVHVRQTPQKFAPYDGYQTIATSNTPQAFSLPLGLDRQFNRVTLYGYKLYETGVITPNTGDVVVSIGDSVAHTVVRPGEAKTIEFPFGYRADLSQLKMYGNASDRVYYACNMSVQDMLLGELLIAGYNKTQDFLTTAVVNKNTAINTTLIDDLLIEDVSNHDSSPINISQAAKVCIAFKIAITTGAPGPMWIIPLLSEDEAFTNPIDAWFQDPTSASVSYVQKIISATAITGIIVLSHITAQWLKLRFDAQATTDASNDWTVRAALFTLEL